MFDPNRKARVKLEHKIQYNDPLEITFGQRVIVGPEDNEFPGWKWCRSADGRAGWVPVEFLSIVGTSSEAIVLDDYSARELAVLPGEEVVVEEARHHWLLVRNANGQRGWIPERNTELLRKAATDR